MFITVMASISLFMCIVIAVLEDEPKVRHGYAIAGLMAFNWLLSSLKTL